MFSREALTNNLWESHPTQLELNNTSPHPRMTSARAGNRIPGSCWLGALRNGTKKLLLVVMLSRGPKHLHMFSSEGRRQKNTGKEEVLLGYIA